MNDPLDPMRNITTDDNPMRGITLGVAIGACIWIIVIVALLWR